MKKRIAPGASVGVGGDGNHVPVGTAVSVPTISVLLSDMDVSITWVELGAGVDREELQDANTTIMHKVNITLMIVMFRLPWAGMFNP